MVRTFVSDFSFSHARISFGDQILQYKLSYTTITTCIKISLKLQQNLLKIRIVAILKEMYLRKQ